MLFRVKTYLKHQLHDFRIGAIFRTPPLRIQASALRYVSLVSHRDLLMYLVAIKSIYNRIGEGSIVVINDGTLTADDLSVLDEQLGNPLVLPIKGMHTGVCPTGGCWERLLAIMDIVRENYVIQIDSDTVSCGSIPEVIQAYRENRSFALGTRMGQHIISAEEAAQAVAEVKSSHVQIAAEQMLPKLTSVDQLRYIRGSAGFSGFAIKSFTRDRIQEFSIQMQQLLGDKWREWGSEQVASNFSVANSPNPVVLPYPKYANFDPGVDAAASVFLHFIGTYRFERGIYAWVSQNVIQELGRAIEVQ